MTDNQDDFHSHENAPAERPSEPVFNLPGLLLITLGLLAVVYLVGEYLLSGDGYAWYLFTFGFIPMRYVVPFSEQGYEWLWTPITYSLMHGSTAHIVFNGLWLAAFGTPVMRRIGAGRFILFWCLSAAVSAFGHAALNWQDITVLIGASGVVSALMGAACRFAFPPSGAGYNPSLGHLYPRQSIVAALRNRTVVIFTAMWLLGNILVAVGVPIFGDVAGAIAWDAHIFGFLFGFLLFDLFDPLPRQIR
ncbi:rhomboid family intramembrane serine protease [Agrobacterium sp.]|uniref:rhomboid family intramembrane serine protease n=1 Tax=Agrobacterium sp. TaxID=361 RepID=UPI0028B04532|nr:rhomboid family intramembrane serine protease [Agrobacterium sp.]